MALRIESPKAFIGYVCATSLRVFAACLLPMGLADQTTGDRQMYHNIEFRLRGLAELETRGKSQMERLVIKQGTRLSAEIRPYVVETERGPIEVADFFLEDGSIAWAVRFATFRFVDV
jgi:hypothetical protein